MRPAIAGELARKELVSWVRDRRALLANLIIPIVVMPLALIGLPLLMVSVFAGTEREAQRLAVTGSHLPLELRQVLEVAPFELVITPDPAAAVREGDADGGLLLGEKFEERLAAGEVPEVVILGQFKSQKGQLVRAKLREALRAYGDGYTRAELLARGVDLRVLDPIAVGFEDLSSREQQAAGFLSFMIPLLIVTSALTGGMSVGVDATAGEKERGTFEALLITPATRGEIVIGKGAATFVAAAVTAFLTIAAVLVSGWVVRSGAIPALGDASGADGAAGMMVVQLAVTAEAFLAMLLTAGLLTVFLVAVQIAIAVQARSYKEANSAMQPLFLVAFLPLILLQFAEFLTVTPAFYMIPIINSALLLDALIKGAATASSIAITWGSTLLYAVAAVYFATWMFKREQVLFRN